MKKALIWGLWLVFFGTSLWAAPRKKNGSGCLHSQKEYQKAFRDPKALEKQNFAIDFWKLTRVNNDQSLKDMVHRGELVGVVPDTPTYYLDPRFPEELRYLRLFARWFFGEFAEKFYQGTQSKKIRLNVNRKTGQVRVTVHGQIKRVKLTSLVRTPDYQELLLKRLPDGQAGSATADDPRQSSHLAGATFDISTKDWSRSELCWALDYLYEAQTVDLLINVIWEPRNHVLHIMVFPDATLTDHIG